MSCEHCKTPEGKGHTFDCPNHVGSSPDAILNQMADTFRERGKLYKSNYKQIGKVMAALYPDGIALKTVDDYNRFHLFLMMQIKMTRLVNMDLKHQDSCHDIGVYSAMLESLQEGI